ncbi:MAG: hypothetical protein R6U00_12640 [Prochlorococcaceae cyanobacterium]
MLCLSCLAARAGGLEVALGALFATVFFVVIGTTFLAPVLLRLVLSRQQLPAAAAAGG